MSIGIDPLLPPSPIFPGDLRCTGAGLLFHMDVAGTAINKNAKPVVGIRDGLYLDAVGLLWIVVGDIRLRSCIDTHHYRHPWPQSLTLRLPRINRDPHRHPLGNFDVVAGGVVGL